MSTNRTHPFSLPADTVCSECGKPAQNECHTRRDGPGMPQWISVKDRLPPEDGKVVELVNGVIAEVKEARYVRSWAERQEPAWALKVTHWMPIPELPPHATPHPTSKEQA